jgi:hypothetical protein
VSPKSLLAVLSLVVLLGGARCGSAGPSIIVISPVAPVTTPSFTIDVEVPPGGSFDKMILNGVAIPFSFSFAGNPSALVNPGPPLQDHNTLELLGFSADGSALRAFHDFEYAPPKARLRRITDDGDLIRGPLAHSKLGDYLLENDVARFVVQDVAQRDMYSVGQFGGNLIDAELVANPGRDHFLEIQPMLNLETVINAQTAQIINDGQDGTPAILRTCGPDDLLDFVNPSSAIVDAGIAPPTAFDDLDQPIEACTDYILEAGVPWIRMDTAVSNLGSQTLSLAVGDWLNAAGQLEQWDAPLLLGESTLANSGLISFVGYDSAAGIDYALHTPQDPDPLSAPPNIFTTSGVSVVLYNANALVTLLGFPPPFAVDPGTDRVFTRFLSVGDGSGANGIAMAAAISQAVTGNLEGCVTVGGAPLPGSRVSVVRRNALGHPTSVDGQFVTKGGACPNFSGVLPIGNYEIAAARDGALYEGGGPTPVYTPLAITPGLGLATANIDLPAPGRLDVFVTDVAGEPLPARVTVVGLDPSPPQTFPGPEAPGFGGATLGVFRDPGDSLPFGIVTFGYADADGSVSLDVEPGDYQVIVSRGTEYSINRFSLSFASGQTQTIGAALERALDTSGFVSSDFHVHGIRSADSRVSDARRVLQFAGEGVENAVMTDHHVHTDLLPAIQALGMDQFLTSTIGEEITSFDYGHFNGYPFTIDPTLPSGGSTDWGVAAPPGMDFPSFGAFNATPPEILDLAVNSAQATPDTTVQINHIGSHFTPLRIDTSLAGPIVDDLDDAGRAARRLPPMAQSGNLFQHFPALELWNGSTRGAQSEFLDDRIGVWMNHLNKGLRTTVISDTDTHSYTNLRSAGARTWTASSTDAPRNVSSGEVARSVDAGRAVGGQGLYVQTRLFARDGSESEAHLGLGGSTDMSSSNGNLDLHIQVQAPAWVEFDTIEVYANAVTTAVDPAAPYEFGATPNLVLSEGDCIAGTTGDGDFDIATIVLPSQTNMRKEVNLVVPYRGLTEDTWFVVVARAADGVCEPMFPVYASSIDGGTNATLADLLDGNIGEGGVLALGVTNALWADVDGTPGFQPSNP